MSDPEWALEDEMTEADKWKRRAYRELRRAQEAVQRCTELQQRVAELERYPVTAVGATVDEACRAFITEQSGETDIIAEISDLGAGGELDWGRRIRFTDGGFMKVGGFKVPGGFTLVWWK